MIRIRMKLVQFKEDVNYIMKGLKEVYWLSLSDSLLID
jgi:hypothetical protein